MNILEEDHIIIEAVVWDGSRMSKITPWIKEALDYGTLWKYQNTIKIKTKKGIMIANPGDYIFKDVDGMIYPCKTAIFESIYNDITNVDNKIISNINNNEIEFHNKRIPFYITFDADGIFVNKAPNKYSNLSHKEWFKKDNIPFNDTIRGYYYTNKDESFVMLYVNNFVIPNISSIQLTCLFQTFNKINWIGLGCIKGNVGEVWKPILTIYKGDFIGNDNTSDGYHTFGELYNYRKLYNAAWFNELAKGNNEYKVTKSKRHSDGELCFGGGWFIVKAELPTGQINGIKCFYNDLNKVIKL